VSVPNSSSMPIAERGEERLLNVVGYRLERRSTAKPAEHRKGKKVPKGASIQKQRETLNQQFETDQR